ncbi:MAG: VOC family protein [Pseudomonadota bacterium]
MTETRLGEQLISCAAILVVTDIHRSVAFYRDKLGFEVAQIWGDPPSFAIADTPRASIMLKQADCDEDGGGPTPNATRVGGLWDTYIWVKDLQAILDLLATTGAKHSDPEVTPYGCTEIVVTDPDGYLICFGYCP